LPLTNAVATAISYATPTTSMRYSPQAWRANGRASWSMSIRSVCARVQRSRDALFVRRGMKVDVLG